MSDSDNPDTPHPSSPFRRLDANGQPEWQRPPTSTSIDPYDAFDTEPVTASIAAFPMEQIDEPVDEKPSRGPRGRMFAVVGLVAGAFMLTAVGGGAFLAYRMLLGHDNLATASYAPQGSWGYVAVNTDPTSRAWLDARDLAQTLGIDDRIANLPQESLEDSGEDPAIWDDLIRPAIGREVGLAVWPRDGAAGDEIDPHVAAIVMIADRDKAEAAIDTLLEDETPESATYRDIPYHVDDDGQAIGIVDEAMILADSADGFMGIVDAHLDGALDGQDTFTSAAERAADDPLVFAWVDSAAVMDAIDSVEQFANIAVLAQPMQPFGDMTDLGIVTVTMQASGDDLRIVTLTEKRPESFPTGPAGERFAADMAASTLFYMAGSDLYETIWLPAMEQMDAAAAESGPGDIPSEDDLEGAFGADIQADLLAHMTGPWAVAMSGDDDGGDLFGYSGALAFYTEVDDTNAVLNTIDALAGTLEESGTEVDRNDDGISVSEPGRDASVTVRDGVLHVSVSLGGSGGSGSLAEDPGFRQAMDSMPADAVMTGYFAVNRILDLIPADSWADLDTETRSALRALGPLAWATAPDGDGTRTEMVLVVGE